MRLKGVTIIFENLTDKNSGMPCTGGDMITNSYLEKFAAVAYTNE